MAWLPVANEASWFRFLHKLFFCFVFGEFDDRIRRVNSCSTAVEYKNYGQSNTKTTELFSYCVVTRCGKQKADHELRRAYRRTKQRAEDLGRPETMCSIIVNNINRKQLDLLDNVMHTSQCWRCSRCLNAVCCHSLQHVMHAMRLSRTVSVNLYQSLFIVYAACGACHSGRYGRVS